MPRYTQAYSEFVSALTEVEILRRRARTLERQDPILNRDEINACCRAAVVLLSSHIEAYVKKLGEITLHKIVVQRVHGSKLNESFFYHISKDLLKVVSRSDQPEIIAAQIFRLIEEDRDYWRRRDKLTVAIDPDRFSAGFSNPSFDKIRSYLNRFGYVTLRHDLNIQLKSDAAPAVQMIDHIVDVRNDIAHGDRAASATPSDILNMVKLVKTLCRATDGGFSRWCGDNLCNIRTST